MSDDDNWEEKRKEWESRLASENPLVTFKVDLPMKIFKGESGELSIDTATFGLMGFDRLAYMRLEITPAAVDRLKWVFANLEKIPDGFVSENKKPSSN